MIPPGRDTMSERVMDVLRLLSKAELKRLNINWRVAEKIKSGDGSVKLKISGLVDDLINFLREHYPEEIVGAGDDEVLRVFVENRM